MQEEKVAKQVTSQEIFDTFGEEIAQLDKIYEFANYLPQDLRDSLLSERKSCADSIILKPEPQINPQTDLTQNGSPTRAVINKSIKDIEKIKTYLLNEIIDEALLKEEFGHFLIKSEDFKKKEIKTNAEGQFRFKLASIVSPYEFYVRAVDDRHDEYQEMTKQMNQFYNTNKAHLDELAFLLKNNFVAKGSVCVVKKGDAFFRAQIVDIKSWLENIQSSDTIETVNVKFLDFYESSDYCIEEVFPLFEEYCTLPGYCIECRLGVISPVKGTEWSSEALISFREMFDWKKEYLATALNHSSQLLEYGLGSSLEVLVDLCDQQSSAIKSVHLSLVILGHVVLTSSKNSKTNPLNLMGDFEDEVFESVSVLDNKMPRGIFRNTNHDQLNGLPEEDEEFRRQRISDYIVYQAIQKGEFCLVFLNY